MRHEISLLQEFVLKKFFDKKQQSVKNRKKQTTPIVKAEAKILFIMCYYITIGTLVLTIHTYYQVAGEAATQAVSRHFACQSIGVQSGRDCGDVPNVFLEVFEAVSDLAVFLIGLLPAVILIFTVNYNCNNKCCKYKK